MQHARVRRRRRRCTGRPAARRPPADGTTGDGNGACFVGVLSGSSADAADAVLVRFPPPQPPAAAGQGARRVEVLATYSAPMPARVRQRIHAIARVTRATPAAESPPSAGEDAIDALGALDAELGELFGRAAAAVMRSPPATGVPGASSTAPSNDHDGARTVIAIGSHGQTVRHRPPVRTGAAGARSGRPSYAFTMQLGDPARIAHTTGVRVVADFRRGDVAAGGQGAPLVPAFHAWLFAHPTELRVILNLGGIANITVLPPGCADDGTRELCRHYGDAVMGYDTGPANVLLDYWCERCTGRPFDRNGDWARLGQVHEPLLAHMLADAYFTMPPPKSTGHEHFGPHWLHAQLSACADATTAAPVDVQRTLVELTAESVASGIAAAVYGTTARPLAAASGSDDCRVSVFACGGGVRNGFLMERVGHRVRSRLTVAQLDTTQCVGLDPAWVEAVCFAWLARERSPRMPPSAAPCPSC